jgi:hypothetical protein
MRKFLLGLIVGGVVVYLWQKGKMSSALTASKTPQSSLPQSNALEAEAGNLKCAESAVANLNLRSQESEVAHNVSGFPSYQTAPLVEYSPEFQALAEELFGKTAALVGGGTSEKHKGSYSFHARNGNTAAKIIIYERRRGKENGAFPMLQDGIYVLLRTQRSAPNTLGIAPKHEERFYYRRVSAADLDGAAHDIADVLQVGVSETEGR